MDEEVRQFQRRVLPEVVFSNIITIGIFALTLCDYLPWRIINSDGHRHVSMKNRFIFTLQLSLLDVLPLLICIFAVFNQRRQTYAINPMDPRGKEFVKRMKGILGNTLEQFILKLILSFILCTILRSRELVLLPVFTFLFILGRFTFALGYPDHRSFGMTMNFVSVILVIGLISYRILFKKILFQSISWK